MQPGDEPEAPGVVSTGDAFPKDGHAGSERGRVHAVAEAGRAVLDAVAARQTEVARQVGIHVLSDSAPKSWTGDDGHLAGEAADALNRVLAITLAATRDARALKPGERVVLGMIGERAARTEEVLDAVLAAWKVAGEAFWSEVAGTAKVSGRHAPMVLNDVMADLALRMFRVMEDVRHAITAGYKGFGDESARTRLEVFRAVLAASYTDEEEITRRAALFGYDLRVAHGIVYLIRTPVVVSGEADMAAGFPSALRLPFEEPVPHTAFLIAANRTAWAEAVVPLVERIAARHHLVVVLAGPVERTATLAAVSERARRVLPTAARMKGPYVLLSHQLQVIHLLASTSIKARREFLRMVEPIFKQGPETELYTRHRPPVRVDRVSRLLTAYALTGGNVDEVAATVGLHSNSVRYHLTRIKERLGLDWVDDRDRLILLIAGLLIPLTE
jgi:hypothetical protein